MLHRHGIAVTELRKDAELDVEVYRVDKITHLPRAFQKHNEVVLDTAARPERRTFSTGTIVVPAAQPLSDLLVYLLEPQSEDGLVTWNFFDDVLAEGKDFPVVRLVREEKLETAPLPTK
jgi:hypothetical protein